MSEEMNSEDNEEIEVNVTELALDGEQVDELIQGLQNLKNNKEKFEFAIDEENDLVFHYDNEEESE